jgi:hypothetical protein
MITFWYLCGMTEVREKSSFIQRLKKRWGITSTFQVIILLVVFAITGFSTLYIEEEIIRLLGIPEQKNWWLAVIIFIFITMPVYNILLLVYGFIFGQFRFFWNFEKRFFGRMIFWRRKKS